MTVARYRYYFLGLLTFILACNYLDRIALGLVLQDIKTDLRLSDTQLGFLSGIAFALFYSIMGLPIARWADRGKRVLVISLTTALWSLMVALCGTAQNFSQLLLIRVGVGVGEAGCIPPAQSLIADYFSRAERPRAVAIYLLGIPLSFLVGYFVAGWLNELYGWRITFVLLGAPGLLLALLARATLREPQRETTERTHDTADDNSLTLRQVCAALWSNNTFRQLLLCLSVIYFVGYGILQWQPTFFIRSFGVHAHELGGWFALSDGMGGLVGTYLGGEWAARRAANRERLQLRATALAIGAFGILSVFIYTSHNMHVAFALEGLGSAVLNTVSGPLFATIQTLVSPKMRATATSLIYFSANLIGLGLGPLAVGSLSDGFQTWAGNDSLRYALLILAPSVYLWGAWHAWKASNTVGRDLASLRQTHAGVDHETVCYDG